MLTPEQLRDLAAMRADPALSLRVEVLAEKANKGELSEAERAEHEEICRLNNLLAIVQAQARFRLEGGA